MLILKKLDLCKLHVKDYRLMLIGLTWPLKIECDHQKGSFSFNFYEKVLDMVTSHKVYSFLNGCSNYHQIMIASKTCTKLLSLQIGEPLCGLSCCNLD